MSYITFKTIGEAGNLGSQVQQYASLYAVAREANKEIVFPESCLKLGYGFKFAELLNITIKIMPDEFFKDFVDIRPNDQVLVDPNMFKLDPNINYNIVNRFDLFSYWHYTHSADVMNWGWNKEHLTAARSLYKELAPPNKETVAIHVRRGDYLLPQHNHFCQLDTDYYNEALSSFLPEVDKYHFLIFSNDIEWCKEYLIEGKSVTYVEPGSDYVDLILMSLCDHQIIANSSYSWWAAYKNENRDKKVICPKNYLKASSPWANNINGNFYPWLDWTSINNVA